MKDMPRHVLPRGPRRSRRGNLPGSAALLLGRPLRIPFVLALGGLAIAACAGSSAPMVARTAEPTQQIIERPPTNSADPNAVPAAAEGAAPMPGSPAQDLARSDAQGAVEVTVSPVVWSRDASGTLEFEVSMNTHSVDLSMNLAELATLETDTGATLQALDWSGGSGHHVLGVLRFPSGTPEGLPLLQNATRLTLTLRDVDVPARVFQWDLSSLP